MLDTEIRIHFLSDWHVGSGLGSGAVADSILNRDVEGIPFIPGRAVKGALRESAWRLGLCRRDLAEIVDYLLGSESLTAASNKPGKLKVGSARLPRALTEWLLSLDSESRSQFVSDMTLLRAQTALTENRMVKPQSLRTIECGIPGLVFNASLHIEAPALDEKWLATYISAVCAGVKSIGADRARGLGNCNFLIASLPQSNATLPPPLNLANLKAAEARQ